MHSSFLVRQAQHQNAADRYSRFVSLYLGEQSKPPKQHQKKPDAIPAADQVVGPKRITL